MIDSYPRHWPKFDGTRVSAHCRSNVHASNLKLDWGPQGTSWKAAAGHLLSVFAGIRGAHGIHFNFLLSTTALPSPLRSSLTVQRCPSPSQHEATIRMETKSSCTIEQWVQMLHGASLLSQHPGLASSWNSKTSSQPESTVYMESFHAAGGQAFHQKAAQLKQALQRICLHPETVLEASGSLAKRSLTYICILT